MSKSIKFPLALILLTLSLGSSGSFVGSAQKPQACVANAAATVLSTNQATGQNKASQEKTAEETVTTDKDQKRYYGSQQVELGGTHGDYCQPRDFGSLYWEDHPSFYQNHTQKNNETGDSTEKDKNTKSKKTTTRIGNCIDIIGDNFVKNAT